MSCEHELEAEFLHPSDVEVLDLWEDEGELMITFAVPCPDCDQAIEVEARKETQREAALSLPLDDAEDVYD